MRFCHHNSVVFDEERTNYNGYQLKHVNLGYRKLGYYLCHGDELTIENLKLATYPQAKQNCTKLLTPRICTDSKLSGFLLELIASKELQCPGNDSTY